MNRQRGKLIVIEAGDGSGKATQTRLLFESMKQAGRDVRQISFPDYNSEASAPLRMYLNGVFGRRPSDVNPYAASTFFAIDRYASYRTKWRDFFCNGGIVLADRYTTSNMVHQVTKLQDKTACHNFLQWVQDFEYDKLGLPAPDLVIFLDMPPAYAEKLITLRVENTGRKRDIHEADKAYLVACYAMYREIAKLYSWQSVSCIDTGGRLRSINAIHQDICRIVDALWQKGE